MNQLFDLCIDESPIEPRGCNGCSGYCDSSGCSSSCDGSCWQGCDHTCYSQAK